MQDAGQRGTRDEGRGIEDNEEVERARGESGEDMKARGLRERKPRGTCGSAEVCGSVRRRDVRGDEYEGNVGRGTKWTEVQARNEGDAKSKRGTRGRVTPDEWIRGEVNSAESAERKRRGDGYTV